MWSVTTVGEAGEEPVSLDEIKEQCGVESDDHNHLLERLGRVARETIEKKTGILLREQTVQIVFDEFTSPLILPRAPLSSVSSLAYVDADGADQVRAIDSYELRTLLDVPSLRPTANAILFPAHGVRQVAVIAAGGFTPATAPETLKHAILMLAGHYWTHRDAFEAGDQIEVPYGVASTIADERLRWL